jgi:hypothetical protein
MLGMRHTTIVLQLPFQRTREGPLCVKTYHQVVCTNQHTADLPVRMVIRGVSQQVQFLEPSHTSV